MQQFGKAQVVSGFPFPVCFQLEWARRHFYWDVEGRCDAATMFLLIHGRWEQGHWVLLQGTHIALDPLACSCSAFPHVLCQLLHLLGLGSFSWRFTVGGNEADVDFSGLQLVLAPPTLFTLLFSTCLTCGLQAPASDEKKQPYEDCSTSSSNWVKSNTHHTHIHTTHTHMYTVPPTGSSSLTELIRMRNCTSFFILFNYHGNTVLLNSSIEGPLGSSTFINHAVWSTPLQVFFFFFKPHLWLLLQDREMKLMIPKVNTFYILAGTLLVPGTNIGRKE